MQLLPKYEERMLTRVWTDREIRIAMSKKLLLVNNNNDMQEEHDELLTPDLADSYEIIEPAQEMWEQQQQQQQQNNNTNSKNKRSGRRIPDSQRSRKKIQ